MFQSLLIVSSILLIRIDRISSSNSGVKMQISQRGLEYAAEVASAALKRRILDKELGGVSGGEGDLSYRMDNVKITECTQRSTSVLIGTNHITWYLVIDKLKTSADWNYNLKLSFIRLKDNGSLTLEATDLSLSVSVVFGFNSDTGTPTIRTTGCNCSVGDISMRFAGRNKNIYDALSSSAFKSGITETVEEELCKSARNEIDESGNEELTTLVVDVRLSEDLYFDYRMTVQPEIKDGYIETSHAGTAFGGSFPREPLLNAQPSMDERPNDEMVSFLISEDSLNTYGRILISKETSTMINRDDLDHLDENNREFLDTNCEKLFCFVDMIPNIPVDEYPDSLIEIDLRSSDGMPRLKISPHGVHSNVSGDAVIYIRMPNETRFQLATIPLHALFNISVGLEDHVLRPKLMDLVPYLDVGEINQLGISGRGVLNSFNFLSKVLIDRINDNIKDGVPLMKTSRKIKFENTEILLNDRFLRLRADLKHLEF